MDLNKVILIGRIASDPEMNYTPSGVAVIKFRLAVNRPISSEARNNGQEKQADFIPVVAWRQSAEYVNQYLGKGRLIAVEGRLQVRQYTTQDGQNRRDTEVVADTVKGLDRPKEQDGQGYSQQAPRQQPAHAAVAAQPPRQYMAPPDDELDDPFADN